MPIGETLHMEIDDLIVDDGHENAYADDGDRGEDGGADPTDGAKNARLFPSVELSPLYAARQSFQMEVNGRRCST